MLSDKLTGISILVAVYNYSVEVLLDGLTLQLSKIKIPAEVIFMDDCSANTEISRHNLTLTENRTAIRYIVSHKNVGRSAIRNRLAQQANYSHLLFIDVDSKIVNPDFLENYLLHIEDAPVIAGGTVYSELKNSLHSLRFYYGKNREEVAAAQRNQDPYAAITLNNLFIEKTVYLKFPLDEQLTHYGHEDTKFGYELKANNVSLLHIDNPVEHIGLEDNPAFLEKTKLGVINFVKLVREGLGHESKLYRAYQKLERFHTIGLFRFFYTRFSKKIMKNLLSEKPSIRLFDLYKLHIFIDELKKVS
ncbi:MAG: glycosyltransferase [Flavobacteriia bacterium]|nr:glycosyltransferase [Flavobacteriia bacterium]OJX35925.1 MAG: hypothetical protein BGO87_05485 [Flavobacteriia bacterium 40-80]